MTEKLEPSKDNILAIVGILFFVVLALTVRFGGKEEKQEELSPSSPPTTAEVTPTPDVDIPKSFENIEKKNYHFTYTVNNNQITEIIDGKVNGNKMKFTILSHNREEYAKISNQYLKLEDGTYKIYQEEIRPYLFYLNLDTIYEILELSALKEEETDYQTYRIDIVDLLDMYTNIEYDSFEDFKSDTITLYFDKEQKTNKIVIDYSNYFSYLSQSPVTFQATMEFDQFGTVEEINL